MAAAMNNHDRDFRERFDLAATCIGLAIVALAFAPWIAGTISRLYY